MKSTTSLTAITFALLAAASSAVRGETPAADEKAILSRIQAPAFPARDFLITEHGANEGEDASEAIAKTIRACHNAGGGRVVVPKGTWITGAVRLFSGVNLHLEEGAKLKFDPDPNKYLPAVLTRFEGMEIIGYSPLIYAFEQENVAITGKGTLDGSADQKNWWPWKGGDEYQGGPNQQADRDKLEQQVADDVPVKERNYGEGHYLRPSFIEPHRCKNVLIEGVTVINAPMWVIHPLLCSNVTVRGVSVRSHGPNNDGCDPESCRDVLIENCVFDTGDDCIAIKSGRNNDGRRVGVPSENIIIRDCTMRDGHGGVTMGSEVSGDVRNIFISDCRLDSPELDHAFRFKSNAMRGGMVENIYFRDIQIGVVKKAVLGVEFDYEEGANGPHMPVLRHVRIERVAAESCDQVVSITGFQAARISDIHFKDCTFQGVKEADVVEHAEAPVMENTTVETLPKKKKP
ncbi:MAG: glycoside hydrolase family 28 protein [Verrucomicrobiales bacterium]|nr:glycoside hydrolase family 28 protein [Verrucomicrobiales bacterium]